MRYVAIVAVASAGPPWVSTQIMSKHWIEPIMDRNAQVRIVGPSSGIVIRHCVCHQEAPSSWAASWSSSETPCMPARKSSTARPRYFQVSTRSTIHRAYSGVPSQPCSGGVSPIRAVKASMKPYCGCSSWSQTTAAMTSASTYGTKMIVRSRPWPRIFRLSRSAMATPSGSWSRIEPTTMTMLWPTALRKTSSPRTSA